MFITFFGLESLAHFADAMLLSGLVFVNVALIRSRRTEPDSERRFRVPGVPWVPLLAVGSSLALLASLERLSRALGVVAVTAGISLWFVGTDWFRSDRATRYRYVAPLHSSCSVVKAGRLFKYAVAVP